MPACFTKIQASVVGGVLILCTDQDNFTLVLQEEKGVGVGGVCAPSQFPASDSAPAKLLTGPLKLPSGSLDNQGKSSFQVETCSL